MLQIDANLSSGGACNVTTDTYFKGLVGSVNFSVTNSDLAQVMCNTPYIE